MDRYFTEITYGLIALATAGTIALIISALGFRQKPTPALKIKISVILVLVLAFGRIIQHDSFGFYVALLVGGGGLFAAFTLIKGQITEIARITDQGGMTDNRELFVHAAFFGVFASCFNTSFWMLAIPIDFSFWLKLVIEGTIIYFFFKKARITKFDGIKYGLALAIAGAIVTFFFLVIQDMFYNPYGSFYMGYSYMILPTISSLLTSLMVSAAMIYLVQKESENEIAENKNTVTSNPEKEFFDESSGAPKSDQ